MNMNARGGRVRSSCRSSFGSRLRTCRTSASRGYARCTAWASSSSPGSAQAFGLHEKMRRSRGSSLRGETRPPGEPAPDEPELSRRQGLRTGRRWRCMVEGTPGKRAKRVKFGRVFDPGGNPARREDVRTRGTVSSTIVVPLSHRANARAHTARSARAALLGR